MKKITLILALVCISVVSYSQSKIQLKSYIEGGYYNGQLSWKQDIYNIAMEPKTVTSIYNSTGNYFKNRVYSEVGFSAGWKGFTANTTFLTIISPVTVHSFQPLQSFYTIGLNYQYKNIVFKAEHMCTHSTETYMIGGGYTKFGVRFYFINNK